MKSKTYLCLFLFILSGLLFSSCSSTQFYTFSSSARGYVTPATPAYKKLAPEDRYARDNEFSPQENLLYSEAEASAAGVIPESTISEGGATVSVSDTPAATAPAAD